MTNLVDVLLRSFEKRLASESGPMMAAEAMRGILILSDLFRTDQWRWMCQLFLRMLEEVTAHAPPHTPHTHDTTRPHTPHTHTLFIYLLVV
jgi:hypothetical protein